MVVMTVGIEFREVAQRLTAEQFARAELPMKGNRAKCPACDHPDHFNLAFLRDGKAYCHKCHFVGDVVSLAAKTWHTSQMNAARTLNQEFHLGLSDGGPAPTILKQKQVERAAQLEEQREQEERWLTHCPRLLSSLDEFHAACEALRRYDPDDLSTPAAEQALARAAIAKAKLDDVWTDMTGNIPDYGNGVLLDLLTGQVMDT